MISPLELTLFLLLAAVVGVVVFRMLNLPPMLGYLTVGILIGPHALALVGDLESVAYLAEFGVVFLMFSVGLEFSLGKLHAMRRIVIGLGGAQVASTILLAVGAVFIARLFMPMSWWAAIALGAAFAMSSTAIVSKMLAERLELESPHGRNILGVLLFQDLAVVPLLILISAFGQQPRELVIALALAAVKIAATLALMLWAGQRFMTRWFDLVVRRRSQELFMLNLLLVTLGAAFVTDALGLSMALGAFVAGILIAETPYRHQVEEDIMPFRDVLLGLFFITTGMQFDPAVLLSRPVMVLALFVGSVLLKGLTAAGLARVFGATPGVAMRTGIGLAQAGEFGFVMMNLIAGRRLTDPAVTQIILAAMLLSMFAAPFLIHHMNRIVLRLSSTEWLMQSLQMTRIATETIKSTGHVVICGYGRSGQNLARLLEREGIAYVALDLDPDRIAAARAAGESVAYGDAARREALIAAGVQRALAVAITYANTPSALKVLNHLQDLAPTLPVVVRTIDDADLDQILAAGATEVIPETVEGSLMLASHMLVVAGVPMRRVLRQIEALRDARYSLLRGYFHGLDDENAEGDRVQLQSVRIDGRAAAVGRSLGEFGLAELGVQVTVIRRRGIRGVEPDADTTLYASDIVVLRGLPEALGEAQERLLGVHV
jgi:CPA2 family monovalent cation:H+ antiporter-2